MLGRVGHFCGGLIRMGHGAAGNDSDKRTREI